MVRWNVRILAAFVFVGSLLLFSMEPMVGKLLIPSFGSGYHIWSTTLMWYQGVLFIAYCYAHVFGTSLRRWHPLVLLCPLLFLPFSVGARSGDSIAEVVSALNVRFAVPFFVIATTSIVAQKWLAASTDEDPYPLYAASNAGSLLALIVYTLAIEPFVGLASQTVGWAFAFLAYIGLGVVAWYRTKPSKVASDEPISKDEAPSRNDYGFWMAVSGGASALSLGTTNFLTLDLGHWPAAWMTPLGLYLLSFIFAFSTKINLPRSLRRLWALIGVAALVPITMTMGVPSYVFVCAAMFIVCWVAHRELFESRPSARYLTNFYLAISFGGWLGSIFVAFLAPVIFNHLYESHSALLVICLSIALRRKLLRKEVLVRSKMMAGVFALLCGATLGVVVLKRSSVIEQKRSYYGVYSVLEEQTDEGVFRKMLCGGTVHGAQLLSAPDSPASYYQDGGPFFDLINVAKPQKLAVLGLGVGGLAAYSAVPSIVFYEIDPVVTELARAHFSYLSGPRTKVVHGDARRELGRVTNAYDVMIVDAFSGDAVPTHLLTVEALDVYLGTLDEDKTILFHISNRHVDLAQVVSSTASLRGLSSLVSPSTGRRFSVSTVLVTKDETLKSELMKKGWEPSFDAAQPWTDDYSSVMPLLYSSFLK